MILSCSTNTFGRHALREALRHIRGLGYQGVELLADVPHLSPEMSDRQIKNLQRDFFEHGDFRVVNINANTYREFYSGSRAHVAQEEGWFGPSLCDVRKRERAARLFHVLRSIEMAAMFRCPSVSITSGRPAPGCLPEDALEIFGGSLDVLLKSARSHGVCLGIEYEPGLLIESGQEVQRLLDVFRSPWLGVNFDVGHAVVCGESVPDMVGAFGDAIAHVHVEDIRGQKHFHRIPGDGDIDFDEMVRALRHAGYHGALTVELYPYAHNPIPAARQAFKYMTKVLEGVRRG